MSTALAVGYSPRVRCSETGNRHVRLRDVLGSGGSNGSDRRGSGSSRQCLFYHRVASAAGLCMSKASYSSGA
jgi:hypothetical protein